ncbi:zinc metalloproteinase dpy-31-like [Haliotis asinina]|uniref:zinc metalloproteinase dpy-31-like n=1 Tax=Haliotis asinina TaxID=109174 RepID=UPI0035324C2B
MGTAFLRLLFLLLSYVLAKGEVRTIKKSSDDEATNSISESRTGDGTSVVSSSNVRKLLGKTFDFSSLVKATDTVELTLANQTLNRSAFTVDESNAMSLQSMLEEHSLSDIMYIAIKIARIEKKIADKFNYTLESLALEDIFDSDDDLVLTRKDVDEMEREINQESRSRRLKRKARVGARWSTTIPYNIDPVFFRHAAGMKAIKEGIHHWEEETCLKFEARKHTRSPILLFQQKGGCYSFVGKQSFSQTISIGRGCETKGVVAHEIGHALGFWHEHSRPDRDNYVTIHYENIQWGKGHEFYSKGWEEAESMGMPYDYSSLMHYDGTAFSRNWAKTITAKEADMDSTLGSRRNLSFYDVKLANLMYCSSKCEGGLSWDACRYEGYRDPKNCNRCKCPDGLTGDFCSDVKPGKGAVCGDRDLEAASEWQTLKSPNYGRSWYPANSECSWRIKVVGNFKRILVRFKGHFSFPCHSPCLEYVEIRNAELSKAGPRYCCNSAPKGNIVSHGNEMLILMRAYEGYRYGGFSLEYKTEPCGGCSSSTSRSGPACVDTQMYTCRGRYFVWCGNGICPRLIALLGQHLHWYN